MEILLAKIIDLVGKFKVGNTDSKIIDPAGNFSAGNPASQIFESVDNYRDGNPASNFRVGNTVSEMVHSPSNLGLESLPANNWILLAILDNPVGQMGNSTGKIGNHAGQIGNHARQISNPINQMGNHVGQNINPVSHFRVGNPASKIVNTARY